MSKFGKALKSFSEVSSIHGISYVFSSSIPKPERVLWAVVTLVSLSLSTHWSISKYTSWQEKFTITTIKDTAKPVTSIPFPAVTICTSGLDMDKVMEVILKDFKGWKQETGKRSVDFDEDAAYLREYMRTKYNIKDDVDIFDVIRATVSPDPTRSLRGASLLESLKACQKDLSLLNRRKKREVTSNFVHQESGYSYYSVEVREGLETNGQNLFSTCREAGMTFVCNLVGLNQSDDTACTATTFRDPPFEHLARKVCNGNISNCPLLANTYAWNPNLECKERLHENGEYVCSPTTKTPVSVLCVASPGILIQPSVTLFQPCFSRTWATKKRHVFEGSSKSR